MAKRPSLESSYFKPKDAPQPPAAVAQAAPEAVKVPKRPATREGKRVISVFVAPEAVKRLGILAIEESSSVQALMVEAVNDLFAKKGINRLA